MKTEQKRAILESGNYKDKIHLYLTELAGLNTGGDEFLTMEERYYIVKNLKGKEIDYYKQLLQYNRAFIMYKNMLSSMAASIKSYCYKIPLLVYIKNYEELLEDCKLFGDKIEDSGRRVLLDIKINFALPTPDWIKETTALKLISELNIDTVDFKEVLEKSKAVLKKYLPLKPYQDFLKDLDKEVKESLTEVKDFILEERKKHSIKAQANRFLFVNSFKGAKGLKIEPDTSTRVEFDSNTGLVIYEKIKVKVFKEDIENIINAGI